MSSINRRTFLRHSSAALAGSTVCGLFTGCEPAASESPNDKIRIAVAGVNNRGKKHIESLSQVAGVDVVCIVDPDTRLHGPTIDFVNEQTGNSPKAVADIRTALDDPNIDAISIATPNHWHSLMTIWGCQAGKDVYVEKPMSHNFHEGRVAVEAARKYDRIVQHGTQSRTTSSWAQGGLDFIKSGKAGKLQVARGICYKPRAPIGFKQTKPSPQELDFNLWLGPAPRQPFHENLVHYNWHWFWDTGNGDIGNQGLHQLDVARWAIDGATLPQRVICVGGRFGEPDQGQTPNTEVTLFDFDDVQMIFEVRGLPTEKYRDMIIGNSFHCEDGVVADGNFYPHGSDEVIEVGKGGRGAKFVEHMQNFVDAVRSRDRASLNAEVLEGHYSSALAHLANASYRLGRPASYDAAKETLGDDTAALESIKRMQEHLAENNLRLTGDEYVLGRMLEIDVESETIKGDDEATHLLTGAYREPFEVPASIS